MWDNNKCMSNKNIKKITKCTRNNITSDFCFYHNKKQIYNKNNLNRIRSNDINLLEININKINKELYELKTKLKLEKISNAINDKILKNTVKLNDNNIHNLLGMYDDWKNIPFIFRIYIDNEWWDIRILINNIVNQLNQCKMENPYPIFPNNPFTRKLFSYDDLIKLKKRIKLVGIKINIVFKLFLNLKKNIILEIYYEAKNNYENNSSKLLVLFNQQFRYKLINFKDSQNCYIGCWVKKKVPHSRFEIIYYEWLNCPYQIYDYLLNIIIPNDEKDDLAEELMNLNKENWTSNAHCLEFL